MHRIDGIPVTTAARTLHDLAAVVSSTELERASAEARVRRLVRRRDLADELARNRGRRGTRALRSVLELEGGPALTRSEAERRLLRLVRAAELPVPRANARLGRHEVAAGYAAVRVTWRQLVDAPEAVIARIAATLAVRRASVGE